MSSYFLFSTFFLIFCLIISFFLFVKVIEFSKQTLPSTFKFVFERSFALKFLLDCPPILIQESITIARRIKNHVYYLILVRNDRYVSIVAYFEWNRISWLLMTYGLFDLTSSRERSKKVLVRVLISLVMRCDYLFIQFIDVFIRIKISIDIIRQAYLERQVSFFLFNMFIYLILAKWIFYNTI